MPLTPAERDAPLRRVDGTTANGTTPLWPLALMGARVDHADGAVLYRKGEPLRDVALIVAGSALLVGTGDYEAGLVAIRGENWLLSAAPAVRGLPTHVATAFAWGDCGIRRLSVPTFLELLRTDACVAALVTDILAVEAVDNLDLLVAMGRADLRSRLLHVLTILFRSSPEGARDGPRRLRCGISRTLLARLVSAERESVVRQLSLLEREGWIARDNGWLIVPERSPLQARVRRGPASGEVLLLSGATKRGDPR